MINFKEETQKGECLKPMEFSLLVKLRYIVILEMGVGVCLQALVCTPLITPALPMKD